MDASGALLQKPLPMYEPIYDVGVPRMRNTVAHRGLNCGWTLACPAISHSLAEGSPTVVFAMRSGFSLGVALEYQI